MARKKESGSSKKSSFPSKIESRRKEDKPLIKVTPVSTDRGDGQSWSTKNYPLHRVSSAQVISLNQKESFLLADTEPPKFYTRWDEAGKLTPFLNVIVNGDLQKLQKMKTDFRTKEAEEALNLACKLGHNHIVKYLLDNEVNAHFKDAKSSFDAISIATYFDHGDVIISLLNCGQILALPKIEVQGLMVSLLHFATIYNCQSAVQVLVTNDRLRVDVNEADEEQFRPLHYAVARGNKNIANFLLEKQANPNLDALYKICPIHLATYKKDEEMISLLLDFKADPNKLVSLNPPRYSFSFELRNFDTRKHKTIPHSVFYNSKIFSTVLHWAVVKGSIDLIKKIIDSGASVDIHDTDGYTPLGLALFEDKKEIVEYLANKGIKLSDEDKNWRRIADEEVGLRVVKILEETKLDTLHCCNKDKFSLLHLAASEGYLTLLNRLLGRGVDANVETKSGETPLFYAVESSHQGCMQQLIRAGGNVCHVSKKNASILHTAAKNNNFAAIDEILSLIEKDKRLDINLADESGYTAIYYAVNKERYDIVQRFVQYCVANSLHVKATHQETLLQFYTERNILDQHDNNIVRVLELEKALHNSKISAEKCVRMQLGTTLASTKAREQLQAMYDLTKIQLYGWYLWYICSCFVLPAFLYSFDVYTDVILAVEYYNDYLDAINATDRNGLIERPLDLIFKNITESQSKINFTLTLFFLLCPMLLLGVWSFYIHLTQPDIMPCFRKMPRIQRAILYFILLVSPLGPIFSFLENTYAQINYMIKTSELSSTNYEDNTLSGHCLREYYNLKHVAQMRVAIGNVLEATLESAYQLILQLYILGTQYSDVTQLHFGNITVAAILSLVPTNDSQTRLSKQVLSVILSLFSLTWSFTAYHRFSKLGGLSILWSFPLLFAIFFQVVSRAIACTVFTLAYTWRIFIVQGVHFILVCFLKVAFERRTDVPKTPILKCNMGFSYIRQYFYVILGTFTSTFVYFRIQRPQETKELISRRHSTFIIQTLFLVLVFVENILLYGIGISVLPEEYDRIFKIVSAVFFLASFLIGVVLQYVYYACFGHPWVDINGPSYERDKNGAAVLSFHNELGITRWTLHSCCDWTRELVEDDTLLFTKNYSQNFMPNGNAKKYIENTV